MLSSKMKKLKYIPIANKNEILGRLWKRGCQMHPFKKNKNKSKLHT